MPTDDRMYHRDHEPAHFHVLYQGNEAKIEIENLALITGHLPAAPLVLSSTGQSCTRTNSGPTGRLAGSAINDIRPLV